MACIEARPERVPVLPSPGAPLNYNDPPPSPAEKERLFECIRKALALDPTPPPELDDPALKEKYLQWRHRRELANLARYSSELRRLEAASTNRKTAEKFPGG